MNKIYSKYANNIFTIDFIDTNTIENIQKAVLLRLEDRIEILEAGQEALEKYYMTTIQCTKRDRKIFRARNHIKVGFFSQVFRFIFMFRVRDKNIISTHDRLK